MKVVLDTNVLVSAASRDRGPERGVLFVAEDAGIDWIVSEAILSEYLDVLARPKFGLASAVLLRWGRMLTAVTKRIDVPASVPLPRDPSYARFLACALTASAEFLVTGHRGSEEARRFSTTTIASASVFERTVCRNWPPR